MQDLRISPGRGRMAEFGVPPSMDDCGAVRVRLKGDQNGRPREFGLNEEDLSRHTLFVGGTGTGKTEQMSVFVKQIRNSMTDNDVMIIFDSKGDYYKRFYRPGDTILGNSSAYRVASQKWNIFEEVLADGWIEESIKLNAMEIARGLFSQRMKNTTNAFFPSAAQDVFTSIMMAILRDARVDADVRTNLLNNEALIGFLNSCSPDELCEELLAYPDLRSATSYIEGGSEQAQGVVSELYSVIRDLFVGVFAGKGNFSMRKFVRNRGKKVLFLEYDLLIGSILTPIYRLLVDLALKEALGQGTVRGNVYLICDEFKLLPHLEHIDDAVNFGRSLGVKVLAGLQSIEQLYDLYGQNRGRCVAAGFSNVFAFRANDEATMRYMRGLYGQNMVTVEHTDANMERKREIRLGNVIEDWTISELNPGYAVVCLHRRDPFVFHFQPFNTY